MVPIHESDVAENRWKVGEWTSVELWEKVEISLRRRRRWIIFATVVLFFSLLAIPVIKDRRPKWRSLSASRQIAERLNALKLEATRSQRPVKIDLTLEETGMGLSHQFIASCESPGTENPTREILLLNSSLRGLQLLDTESASALGLERITRSFCFNPIGDTSAETRESAAVLIPAKDLAEKRTDRLSFVFYRPSTTEFSFD